MKNLYLIPAVFLLMSFTHPFAREGSVDTDELLIEERIEEAQENREYQERARRAVREEQEASEEIDRNLQPDILLQDEDAKEGSIE